MTADTATANNDQTATGSGLQGALGTARDGASHAYEGARDGVTQAAARAGDAVEANPLAVLAGGLALGAIAGALVPRSDKERELLRPLGSKLGATAVAAIAAAKDAGYTELENRGLTKDSARDQVRSLFDGVVKAATTAATAATSKAKSDVTGDRQPDSTGGAGDRVPAADPHRQVMASDGDLGGFNSGF